MKPIIENDQIVTNLKNIINELPTDREIPSFIISVTKLPSVIPTPPGKNEKIPNNKEE
jgi:hypothetical protein